MFLTDSSLDSTPSPKVPFKFLGTMAGDQGYLKGNNDKPTYARTYHSFGGSNDLRKRISKIGHDRSSKGYKDIGDDYSYTPFYLGTLFSSKPTTMQGGGFFLTVKTFDDEDERRILNCFAYALGTFGDKLERLTGKNMAEIQKSVSQKIDHVVSRYFKNVVEPEDGDLAVYNVSPGKILYTPGGKKVSGITHAGVYRKSKPNWNSPSGGTIESKWGWFSNPYVFQHDAFFAPHFYGDQLKFYRL